MEKKQSSRHRKFIRSFLCTVLDDFDCGGRIECAHVRKGLPSGERAGIAGKPHDAFTLPLCQTHHREQHRIGEQSFERKYKVNLLQTALGLARISPCPIVKAKAVAIQEASR